MKQFFEPTKFTVLLVIVALLAAGAAVYNRYTYAKTESPTPAKDFAESNTSLPGQRNVIAGESITLTPRGFEPAEISRGPGRFVLNINNRSGVHEVTFLLEHETGNRLREVRFAKGKLSSRELLNLSPGHYRLTEVHHADWVCKIEITAR